MSDRIPTGCDAIDDLLGGGFERGAVTQVYGPPASGKTNLVLSAAIELAADGDSALFIDTEGLSVERMEQLARARTRDDGGGGVDGRGGGAGGGGGGVGGGGGGGGDGGGGGGGGAFENLDTGGSDVADGAADGETGTQDTADGATDEAVTDLASRLVLSSAHTFEEQEEAVRDAEEFVESVELVVLDSATGFYRLQRTEQEEGEALRAVGRQLAHLLSLARKHDVAVAFTNQVFTDPESDRARGLGGHTLDHWSATILRVERFRGGNRRVTLEKHRAQAAGDSARFQITGDGLSTPTGK